MIQRIIFDRSPICILLCLLCTEKGGAQSEGGSGSFTFCRPVADIGFVKPNRFKVLVAVAVFHFIGGLALDKPNNGIEVGELQAFQKSEEWQVAILIDHE